MSSFFLDDRSMQKAGKLSNMKKDNRKFVLANMDFETPVAVADISDKVRISKTTLSKMMADFCKEGIITHVGKGASTSEGGKKPDLFILNAEYRYALVIQLAEPEYIECAIMNLANQIVISEKRETPVDITYPAALAATGEIVHRLMKKSRLSHEKICGIAVACDGIVDTANKILLRPAHHRWQCNLPIGKDIEKITGWHGDITIDNVCRFGGYAELLFPENRRYGNMIVIWNDDLVGGCVLSNNRLIQGRRGLVGEIGHMVMDMHASVKCSCGGYGCFEPLVSQKTLLEKAYAAAKVSSAQGQPSTQGQPSAQGQPSEMQDKIASATLAVTDIFAAANNGDTLACALLDEVIGYYAVLIRNITNLHEVEKVIIQGCYAVAGKYFYDTLKAKLSTFPLHMLTENMVIEASAYTDKSNRIMGAGFHTITNYFNNGMEDNIL